jgi:hypothetical protein
MDVYDIRIAAGQENEHLSLHIIKGTVQWKLTGVLVVSIESLWFAIVPMDILFFI